MAAPQRRPTDRYRTYVKKSDKLTPRVSIRRFHDIFSAPGFTWIHLDSLGFTWSFSELPLNWKVGTDRRAVRGRLDEATLPGFLTRNYPKLSWKSTTYDA